jgi:hypothetical protein
LAAVASLGEAEAATGVDGLETPPADGGSPAGLATSAVERSWPEPGALPGTVGDWGAQSRVGPAGVEDVSPLGTGGKPAGPSTGPLIDPGRSARPLVASIEPQIGAGGLVCVATSWAERSQLEGDDPGWLRSCRSSRNSTTSEILFFRSGSGPMKKLRQWS